MSLAAPVILLVGDDEALNYLITRYAQRHGVTVQRIQAATIAATDARPEAVWCSSLAALELLRSNAAGLADVPVVVCTSTADEGRARELGADYCLLHPLTFADFVAAMSAVGLSHGLASLAG
jgi:CheY-like chemotaxis protein